jgi:hypothetical protein
MGHSLQEIHSCSSSEWKQPVQRTPVTQHRRCCGTYLHETDLPNTSNGTGVIGAFDLRRRIRSFGRNTRLFCLTSDGLQMVVSQIRSGDVKE